MSALAEVWEQLGAVTDPELDESVTALRFVSEVRVEGDEVVVAFRLPTYWCAANFAYLMADDLRRAAESLPWVRRARVTIDEHMYQETINAGLAERRSFLEAFGASAEAELHALRATFRRKAFAGRQELLLRALLARGHAPAELAAMPNAALAALALAPLEGEAASVRHLRARYQEIRREFGGPAGPADPAFATADGAPLDPAALDAYLRQLRRVRINVEANASLCRGLLAARYGLPVPDEPRFVPLVRRAAAAPAA